MIIINLIVNNLLQHPVHKDMHGDPLETGKDLSSLDDAYIRRERVLPIIYVIEIEDGIEKFYVIDGWSSVLKYKEKGIVIIQGIEVDLENPDELPYLLADLHTNYHNELEEDFRKFTYFFNILSLGNGYRSDLQEDNE